MEAWRNDPGILANNKEECLIMGILNITPDSFYDGGIYNSKQKACRRALEIQNAGADILDIGGESTRPGAESISAEEEKNRVIPVVKKLSTKLSIPISVDTSKSIVAQRALEAGADWINDVSALRNDPDMIDVLCQHDVPVILMHMQGNPRTMQENPKYDDVIQDITGFLNERISYATNQGISRDKIIIDPGIGFGKNLEHNKQLIRNIHKFNELNSPVLLGHSRKSFLKDVTQKKTENRLPGTLAVSAHCMINNVNIIRVHDVEAHEDFRRTFNWVHSKEF